MTASQQPDAEHAPLTSPAAAGSGPTGHGLPPAEAILRFGEHLRHDLEGVDRDPGAIGASLIATSALRWLRAALAAGDADVAGPVAEALGLHRRVMWDDNRSDRKGEAVWFQTTPVWTWTEAP